RRELLELLAESILEGVGRPRRSGEWRPAVLAVGAALSKSVAAQKDAERILLEVPEALQRSDAFDELKSQLQVAGLQAGEAGDVALMVMTSVISGRPHEDAPEPAGVGEVASIAIDSGSRGVVLRAGPPDMQSLIRVPPDQSSAAPAVVRGETVVVRRLRGVGRGEIELNPRRPWRFKVQAPTWNTVLDVGGLDVRAVHVDSGAANLQLLLPAPRGLVPIHISSGVVNVSMRRPEGAAVVALAHTGALKLKLEEFSTKVAVFDVNWQTPGALEARDRYELEISGGVVDFQLGTYVPKVERVDSPPAQSQPKGKPASALEILLDGVEARVASR
ncbi:MAG TPA: hypothetical protein VKF28_09665, partial [Candidatus Dormibacteraeota bacterium]|nr:hypothetical protein [Candidatus Dormibacteraeota bacterium]